MSTPANTSAKIQRIPRSRLLLAIVALGLALWGIKAIHYALQPKYQGKTMEEWFEASYSAEVLFERGYPHRYPSDDPAGEAMRHFGTNAVRYLWQEHRRETPAILLELRNMWETYVLRADSKINSQLQRGLRAEALLFAVRTNAGFLIPRLVAEVDSHDPGTSLRAAHELGIFRISPELCVPALMRALTETQRVPANISIYYLDPLGKFGGEAVEALPLLLRMHGDKNLPAYRKPYFSTVIVEIDSGREHPEYLERVLDTNDLTITAQALLLPARAGILSTSVLPQVKIFADKVTDPLHKRYLTRVIEMLEKQSKP